MEVPLYILLILAALVFLITLTFTCLWLGVCHSCHYRYLLGEPEIAAPAQIKSVSVNRRHEIIDHSGKKLCYTRNLPIYNKHYTQVGSSSQSRLSTPIYEDIKGNISVCSVDVEKQVASYSKNNPEDIVVEENNNSKQENRNRNQNYSSFVHLK